MLHAHPYGIAPRVVHATWVPFALLHTGVLVLSNKPELTVHPALMSWPRGHCGRKAQNQVITSII